MIDVIYNRMWRDKKCFFQRISHTNKTKWVHIKKHFQTALITKISNDQITSLVLFLIPLNPYKAYFYLHLLNKQSLKNVTPNVQVESQDYFRPP